MTATRPVLFEPEAAIAASRCVIARSVSDGRTPQHPRACGWCDYPLADLRSMVEGFNQWAEYSNRSHTFGRHELRVWSEMPRAEQEARIVAAQAFPIEEGGGGSISSGPTLEQGQIGRAHV